MKTKQMKERNKESINPPVTIETLLKRPAFSWPEDIKTETFEEKLLKEARSEAQEKITRLNAQMTATTTSVLEKIAPRAVSFTYEDCLIPYQNSTNLTELLSQSQETLDTLADTSDNAKSVAQRWTANTIAYETRAAIRQQNTAQTKKDNLKQQTSQAKAQKLKKSPDLQYGDEYNHRVCQRLDQLESQGINSDLAIAGQQIEQEISNNITEADIISYLTEKRYQELLRRFKNLLIKSLTQIPENPAAATTLTLILTEIDLRKTEPSFASKKLVDILIQALTKSEPLALITMLCTINDFDMAGGYTLQPDIFAYKQNPRLEPVPFILQELASIQKFFNFYGLSSILTIYISDTDYTEIGQYGPTIQNNLDNIPPYLDNLRLFLTSLSSTTQVVPISQATDSNPLYQKVKTEVLESLEKLIDPEFADRWKLRFENAVEKVCESLGKRGFYPSLDLRKKGKTITKNIWACNAAQGAIFATLGPNTILISTETRARDQNYLIDKETAKSFPPTLYILKSGEAWNRKLNLDRDKKQT